jgi:hypothetical protein
LLIYLWVADELSVKTFHQNDDQLYQVLRKFNVLTELKPVNQYRSDWAALAGTR